MYRESLSLTFRLSKFVFAILFLFLVLSVLEEKELFGGFNAVSFIFIALAFYAHFCVLFPNSVSQSYDVTKFVGFILWNILLFILIMIPTGILTTTLLYGVGSGGDLTDDSSLGIFLFTLMVSYGVSSLFVYSFLGTILPAHIAGVGQGLANAFRRGRQTFFYIFGRLLVGPGLILTISIAVHFFSIADEIVPGSFFNEGWVPNVSTIATTLIVWWIQLWAVIMVAWILSTAFLKSEKTEEAALLENIASGNI